MNPPSSQKQPEPQEDYQEKVATSAARKLSARRKKRPGVWFGIGMFGLVGWSIALPTLAAIFLGVWIDHTWPSRISWTLTLIFVGVVLGCLNAWRWIKRENEHH